MEIRLPGMAGGPQGHSARRRGKRVVQGDQAPDEGTGGADNHNRHLRRQSSGRPLLHETWVQRYPGARVHVPQPCPQGEEKAGEEAMTARLEKVWRAIDPERLKRTLLDLLDIYSPSGKEEDIQLYLEELLTRAGFSVERQEVDVDRYNLRVTMGHGEPRLYMVGHVDTVPAWDLDEFGPEEDDGIIRGLGSADMKGGCAAMVETWLALAEALEPAERPSVGLLLVVGEEEN